MTEIDNKILNGASNRPLNIPFEKPLRREMKRRAGVVKDGRVMK
jgi:hypothetical protein